MVVHMGPDIEEVAKHNRITVEQVIEKHTSKPYLIYARIYAWISILRRNPINNDIHLDVISQG